MTEVFDVQQGITGELREKLAEYEPQETSDKFMTRPVGAVGYDIMMALCDSIDAVHANLERENAELKAELDRVTGEQEEHAHTMGERITDELREYASTRISPNKGQLIAIADRIDAEHERQLEVLYRDMSDAEYVKLPKDADGEYIRIGDELRDDWNEQNQGEVEWLILDRHGWWFRLNNSGERFYANEFHEWRHRHHHAQTVEDVLREFADGIKDQNADFTDLAIAEYSKRLTLAGGAK